MKLAKLQSTLRAADARAVLVPVRALDQIIDEALKLRSARSVTPHRDCYVVDRQALFRNIEQAYLPLPPNQVLPDTVILLAEPITEELGDLEDQRVLLKYWRRLFHACVHLALEEKYGAGSSTVAQRVERRIAEIGRAEFEEIRTVLIQDRYLLEEAGDRSVYIEFAAVYLETRHFAAYLLPGVFPGLNDLTRIDRMLSEELDSEELFSRTRLEGAPDPASEGTVSVEEPESYERYWNLVRAAEQASAERNTVYAAILRTRAWRIAPAAQGPGTHDKAMHDLDELNQRLAKALDLSADSSAQWARHLPTLLDKADQGDRPAEARLLYGLQKVCTDAEREIYALDFVEWAMSAGKRPIKRPLPNLKQVRIIRDLRAVQRHLRLVRLTDADRQDFTNLVEVALQAIDRDIRQECGERLSTALHDVELEPTTAAERVASSKMVSEWLDLIIDHGFLTFSDLRDTISRNQLKLPDLTDSKRVIPADPLLRLDRRLASLLDGVYRPSDIYMRFLERVTALNFGTRMGRWITAWLTIPIGGAAVVFQIIGILLHLLFHLERHPVVRRLYLAVAGFSSRDDQPSERFYIRWHVVLVILLGCFFMALMHSRQFRQRCNAFLIRTGRQLRYALIDVPRRLLRIEALQRLVQTWQFQLVSWYVLKPLLVILPIWLLIPRAHRTRTVAVVIIFLTSALFHSRVGQALTEGGRFAVSWFYHLMRSGLLPGLFRLLMRTFKQLVDGIELVLFTVDDWLRSRSGDSRRSIVVRCLLGIIWFPVSYVARFYVLVLIEPGFNPAKAPASLVAAKVMWPLSVPLTTGFIALLKPVMSDWLAYSIGAVTVWLLPDVFGFLFWETSQNWSLYRANRPKSMRAVGIGPRGETIKSLLKPGFHTGRVPRLFRRLRRAEREAQRTRDWGHARECRLQLGDISQSIQRFVQRELLAMLSQSSAWVDHPLTAEPVRLAVNRVSIELSHTQYAARHLCIEFELRKGVLIATMQSRGWLDDIDTRQMRILVATLAGFFKLAGVDLVREQLQGNLPAPESTWDVTSEGLVVTLEFPGQSWVYSFAGTDRWWLRRRSRQTLSETPLQPDPPPLPWHRLIFALRPLRWETWQEVWEKLQHAPTLLNSNDGQSLVRNHPDGVSVWNVLSPDDIAPRSHIATVEPEIRVSA